jgi:hypothetical protein
MTTNTLTSDVLERISPEQAFEVALLATSTDLGASSAGMIRWAAMGGGDVATYTDSRPLDDDDLGRCERAYDKAPRWLAERMLPLLELFRVKVTEGVILRGARTTRVKSDFQQGLSESRERFLAHIGESRNAELTLAQWSIVRHSVCKTLENEEFEPLRGGGLVPTGGDEVSVGGFTYYEVQDLLNTVNAIS